MWFIMRMGDLDPDLSYRIRIAAAWYNLSPSAYMRVSLTRVVDELADTNPLIREAYNHRP
jgi:hypothetical protein